MATLKSIRKRIQSVKNTQKITRAMKMVAAAKLRRAQHALMGARPHAELLQTSLARLVEAGDGWNHPLLKGWENPKRAAIIVVTSDRGLCGGFNGNLLRKVDHFLRHEGKGFEQIEIAAIGRKGRDFYRAKKVELKETGSLADESSFAQAEAWAGTWEERYNTREIEELYLAYNSFKSAISQIPTIRRVFPLELEKLGKGAAPPVIWEETSQKILDRLLHRYASTNFYLAALESRASELGARMSAMDNATNNANEMIGSLTLQFNRARQAAITLELMDIVNGAEAL